MYILQHATKATPKLAHHLEEALTPNARRKYDTDEPATVVYPETISARTVAQIARQSLLAHQTVVLPTQTDVTPLSPTTSTRTKVIKERELPWQVTPTIDFSKLGNHYLMLSKIRLTSELNRCDAAMTFDFCSANFSYCCLFSARCDHLNGWLCDGTSPIWSNHIRLLYTRHGSRVGCGQCHQSISRSAIRCADVTHEKPCAGARFADAFACDGLCRRIGHNRPKYAVLRRKWVYGCIGCRQSSIIHIHLHTDETV